MSALWPGLICHMQRASGVKLVSEFISLFCSYLSAHFEGDYLCRNEMQKDDTEASQLCITNMQKVHSKMHIRGPHKTRDTSTDRHTHRGVCV